MEFVFLGDAGDVWQCGDVSQEEFEGVEGVVAQGEQDAGVEEVCQVWEYESSGGCTSCFLHYISRS